MAIKFEDAPAPKGKPGEKPAEKARPIVKEDEAPVAEAPPKKGAAKARTARKG